MDVESFKVFSDSSKVIYVADQRIEGVEEIFEVNIESSSIKRLSNPNNVTYDVNLKGFSIIEH